LAAATSSLVSLLAIALSSAMVLSKIYFPLAADPETLKPNKPLSEKWKL